MGERGKLSKRVDMSRLWRHGVHRFPWDGGTNCPLVQVKVAVVGLRISAGWSAWRSTGCCWSHFGRWVGGLLTDGVVKSLLVSVAVITRKIGGEEDIYVLHVVYFSVSLSCCGRTMAGFDVIEPSKIPYLRSLIIINLDIFIDQCISNSNPEASQKKIFSYRKIFEALDQK